MKRILFTLTALLLPATSIAQETLPKLSVTRQLRRIHLTLRGQPPPRGAYETLLAATPDQQQAMLQTAVDEALDSNDFYVQMVEMGHDVLGVGDYGQSGNAWKGGQAVQLFPCGSGTVHEGKLGTFHNDPRYGDPPATCDDSNAMTHTIEPWWAPGTTVETVGWAGAGTTTVADARNPGQTIDCGVGTVGFSWILRNDNADRSVTPRCSCGPNLIYCARRAISPGADRGDIHGYDGFPNDPTGQRRSLFEEPARLFAHIVTNDKPFSDLVVGDYTVVNQGLQHLYVRAARRNSAWADQLDASQWWRTIQDPNEWREVVVETMHPLFVAERNTTFDPRTDATEPAGIPSAGVMTTIGAMGSFARERPRAARWLEIFACREFTPPPATATFPPFERDPATEGVCLQCHNLIDPAAIHFKRFGSGGLIVGGVGPWRIEDFASWNRTRLRWEAQFSANTVMTPATEEQIANNPNSRFIDFLPSGTSLLGVQSDGTVGPLGFGKILVQSGEFDRCAVRRFYERIGGRKLDAAAHANFIDEMVQVFVDNDRKIKPLIRFILGQEAFSLGH